MKTVLEIKQENREKINSLDLELLIANIAKKPREFIIAHPEYRLNRGQLRVLRFYIKRRTRGEPLAYILKEKEFYGLNFKVGKTVLVPRPETELLVDEAIKLRRRTADGGRRDVIFIDIGTGSGCIVITLAKVSNSKFQILPPQRNSVKAAANSKFIATDISASALRIARQNAKLHKVDKKIKFLQGDLLEPIIKNKKLKIENCKLVILANLPYLTPTQIKNSPSIQHEPKLALNAGKDGLKYYRRLIKQIKTLINSRESVSAEHLFAIMEIDPFQTVAMKKIIKSALPTAKIEIKKDLKGLNRFVAVTIKIIENC